MKSFLIHFCCFILIIIASMIPANSARSMAYQDDDSNSLYNNYPDLEIEKFFHPMQKRDCVRRGGSCAYRPNGCCPNTACRCNLWGANCRCQRMGLFQKWG